MLRIGDLRKGPFAHHVAWMAGMWIGAFGFISSASAATPESPEVKAVIEKGLAYISEHNDPRLGGVCLAGVCFLKNGRDQNHAIVKKALAACQDTGSLGGHDNYSLGCALIFLCEYDPEQQRPLAEKYLAELLKRQMSNGGWSYPSYQTGDTSQTQYAVLGMWMAQRHGMQVPLPVVERVTGWLLRTQDPNGGWGYQGKDPGDYTRVAQSSPTHSLTAAGLGSLYVCADLLQIREVVVQEKKEEPGLPSVMKEVRAKKPPPVSTRGISQVIDADRVRQAMALGNQWFQQQNAPAANNWFHYFMYAFERYHSYRELSRGRAEKEPAWYTEGFDVLQRTQTKEGYWEGQDSAPIATTLAILYLSRSSRKAISKVVQDWGGEGVLIGGMGLPTNTADIRERDGKVVQAPLSGSIDELLSIVENASNPDLERLADSKQELKLDSDVTKREGQLNRLRALVSAGSFESRIVAVRTLGKVRELDNVPLLLYALTDPDPQIVREADLGLRFISRKIQGVGLTNAPTQQQIREAQASWKAWFKSIRPDAELLD